MFDPAMKPDRRPRPDPVHGRHPGKARLVIAALLATLVPAAVPAADFDSLAGWWRADPQHGGRSTTVYLELLRADGQPEARLSLAEIGAWDVPLGAGTVEGDTLTVERVAFPLEYDPERDTLRGDLPEAAVPQHRIPAVFRRIDAPPERSPAVQAWDHPRPETVWRHDAGAPVWAGLVHDEGTGLLFVATDAGRVLALAGDSGETAWRFEAGAGVRARPGIAGDHLYIHADDGRLHKLGKPDGRVVWTVRLHEPATGRLPPTDPESRWDHYASSAVEAGDRVFVGGRDGRLHALAADSGRQLWTADAGDLITATPAVWRESVIFAGFDGQVRAAEMADGRLRWTFPTHHPVPADLVVAGDRVLAGSRSYDLYALDAATGERRWNLYLWFSWIDSAPVLSNGTAWLGSSDARRVQAVRTSDGGLLWERRVPGWSWSTPALSGDVLVVTASSHGKLRPRSQGGVLALDARDGTVLWAALDERPDAEGFWGYAASPAAWRGLAWAADLHGNIRAFRLPGR